jgi:hypothetical protein
MIDPNDPAPKPIAPVTKDRITNLKAFSAAKVT